jgi:hypothetical protein
MRASPRSIARLLLMAEGEPAETLRLASTFGCCGARAMGVNDSLHVRLLWCEGDGRVFVAVNDHRTGDAFSVEVPEGERALQVFDHPYAYAT